MSIKKKILYILMLIGIHLGIAGIVWMISYGVPPLPTIQPTLRELPDFIYDYNIPMVSMWGVLVSLIISLDFSDYKDLDIESTLAVFVLVFIAFMAMYISFGVRI